MVRGDVFGPVTPAGDKLTIASGSSIRQPVGLPVPREKNDVTNACLPIPDSAIESLGARRAPAVAVAIPV